MTAAEVREACGELATWLPEAEARIATPDTDTTRTRGQPTSRFPGNGAVFHVLTDALEDVARLEVALRWEVTGRDAHRRPASATGAILAAIVSLAEAVPEDEQRVVVRTVTRHVRVIMQLPSIGELERPRRIEDWPCRYCGTANVWAYPVSGRVACLRGYRTPTGDALCVDTDGNPPVGLVVHSSLNGTPCIAWADGLVT